MGNEQLPGIDELDPPAAGWERVVADWICSELSDTEAIGALFDMIPGDRRLQICQEMQRDGLQAVTSEHSPWERIVCGAAAAEGATFGLAMAQLNDIIPLSRRRVLCFHPNRDAGPEAPKPF